MQELLKSKGITRPSELANAIGIDRRAAWRIWHGKRKIGARMAMRLFEALNIPVHEILRAEIVPDTPPRGRPRKRPAEGGEV